MFKSHFWIDQGSGLMGSSESSNNSLLSLVNQDFSQKERFGSSVIVTLFLDAEPFKFERIHKSTPSSSPILSKYDS